jgi:hypothetical protein
MSTRSLPNARGLLLLLLLSALTLSLGLAPRVRAGVTLNAGGLPAAQTRSGATDLSSLHLPAQGMISAVLGRDHPAYQAVPLGDGFHAENPQHALAADFTPEGYKSTPVGHAGG